MGKQIPLEDLLNDTPQNRSLIRLFEEDTYNLRSWGHDVSAAIDQWCFAQKLALEATSKLASTVLSYTDQKFPLDETSYDIPAITGRVAQTFSEINGWMEIFLQQIECCVQYPIRKVNAELDELVEVMRPNVADAFSNLAEAEEKFLRLSKKDAPRRLEEANNDIFVAKMNYHKLALQYCSRMNAMQSNRYMQFIEPMLALLYAYKSLFNVGHDAFRNEALTNFLTRAQQQMQDIDKSSTVEKRKCSDLLGKLSELSKMEHGLYYGESASASQNRFSDSVQKQGYLRIKLRSGIFTSNWEKYFVYTQGASLMWQKPDQLVGSLMLDFSSIPGCSAEVAGDTAERRFVFTINIPGPGENRGDGDRKWFLQARNTVDMHEWVDVINNLTGTQAFWLQRKPSAGVEVTTPTSQAAPVHQASPVDELKVESHMRTPALLTPSNTPVYELSKLALMGQPIQFDLLSLNTTQETNFDVEELLKDAQKFDVRFLGCIEICSDQGGDSVMQPAIERVLNARTTHSISDSISCLMLISRRFMCVTLLDHGKSEDIKRSRIKRIRRLDSSNRPSYKCSVLSTEDSADASDVCKALETASRESLNKMIEKSIPKEKDVKEEKDEKKEKDGTTEKEENEGNAKKESEERKDSGKKSAS